MRVETSALVTLKNRLRNKNMLTRTAEGGADFELEPEAGMRVLYVSIRNEATMEENRPVYAFQLERCVCVCDRQSLQK